MGTRARCATATRAATRTPRRAEPARGLDPRGAHTRAGTPGLQPAMPNGRCRLHGGRSTGPRTEAGRAALAAARTKHGHHGAGSRAFLVAIDALLCGTPNRLASRRGIPPAPASTPEGQEEKPMQTRMQFDPHRRGKQPVRPDKR